MGVARRAHLPALEMRTVGMTDTGFEPSALTFEVIGLERGETAHEPVHVHLALQGIKHLLRALQVPLYLVAGIGRS